MRTPSSMGQSRPTIGEELVRLTCILLLVLAAVEILASNSRHTRAEPSGLRIVDRDILQSARTPSPHPTVSPRLAPIATRPPGNSAVPFAPVTATTPDLKTRPAVVERKPRDVETASDPVGTIHRGTSLPADQIELTEAIAKATQSSLRSGSPSQWQSRQHAGAISAGKAYQVGSTNCRDTVSTIVNGSSKLVSSPHRWCQDGDDGPWRPAD